MSQNRIAEQIDGFVSKGSHMVIATPAPSWNVPNGEVIMAYSVGRFAQGKPELMLAGLPHHVAGVLINDLADWYDQNMATKPWVSVIHPKDGPNAPIIQNDYELRLFDVFDLYLKPKYHSLRETSTPVKVDWMQEVNGWAPWQAFGAMEKASVPIKDAHILYGFLQDKGRKFCWEPGFTMNWVPDYGFSALN